MNTLPVKHLFCEILRDSSAKYFVKTKLARSIDEIHFLENQELHFSYFSHAEIRNFYTDMYNEL